MRAMGGFDGGLESRGRPDSGSEDERLGARLLKTGVLTPEQLARCLSDQGRLATAGHPTSLADVLLKNGFITGPTLTEALSDVWVEDFIAAGMPPEVAAQSESERFGKFTRIQQLGSGGMGEVWKAWDNQLGRWVALKFLKGRDRADIARLLREAQTAGRLSHANIVAVHEVGSERGEHYIAMQYIEGQTMETYPRKDRKGLVRLIRDAARAVALAHREGIVHRDLKPSNLMVAVRPGAEPHVYVADFGLARSMSDPSRLSRSGMIQGTPEYMSPEQAKGEAVDERTDVWALGATLYELTTDRLPFAASNLVNLLRRIVDEDPKPPNKIQPRISADLQTIILKCLEKDPARRYATADDLAEDLDRYLAREPIQARPASIFYRVRKRLAKRKALVAVTAAALVAVSALAGTLMFRARPERQHLLNFQAGMMAWEKLLRSSFGEIPRKDLLESARQTRAQFERANEWVEKPDAHIMRARCLELEGRKAEALVALERAFALEENHTEARVELARALLAKYQRSRGMPEVFHVEEEIRVRPLRPERTAEKQLRERAKRLLEGRTIASGKADLMEGLLALGQGDYKGAAERLRRHTKVDGLDTQAMRLEGFCRYYDKDFTGALEALGRSLKLAPEQEAYALSGSIRQQLKDPKGALDDFNRAIEIDPKYAGAYVNRGSVSTDLKDHMGAIRDYDKAIELNPNDPGAFNNRGLARQHLGEHEQAIQDFDKTIALEPRDNLAHLNRANSWYEMKDYSKALRDCDKGIELDPKEPTGYLVRSYVRLALNLYDDAVRDCDKAIELDPDSAVAHANRSIAYVKLKEFEKAVRDENKAIELDPNLARVHYNQGLTRHLQNDFEGALRSYDKSIELDPTYAPAYGGRGMVRHDLGDFKGAIQDYDKAIELDPKLAKAYIARGNARQQFQDHREAVRDYDKAIELDPNDPNAYFNRGNSRMATNDNRGAMQDYDKALELNPNDSASYTNRGLVRRALKDLQGAIRDFDKAIELDPKNTGHYINRGVARSGLKDFEGAIRDYDKAIELDPKFAAAYYSRGRARMDLKNYEGAMADYRKTLELVPSNWPHREWAETRLKELESLVKLGGREKEYEEAGRQFDQACELLTKNKHREAIEAFRKVAESFPKTELGRNSAYNAACAHALLGEKTKALDWLEKAVEMGYSDLEHLEKDADLTSLRAEKRYRTLVEKLKSK